MQKCVLLLSLRTSSYLSDRPDVRISPSLIPNDASRENQITSPFESNSNAVEQRLVKDNLLWRESQKQSYRHNPSPCLNSSLFQLSLPQGSLPIFLFFLLWRSFHHYKLADQTFHGPIRPWIILPSVILLIGNMIQFLTCLIFPAQESGRKTRIKTLLNVFKCVELALITYNGIGWGLSSRQYNGNKEMYVRRTMISSFFFTQCQLYTKVAWDATQIQKNSFIRSEENPQHRYTNEMNHPDDISRNEIRTKNRYYSNMKPYSV